MAQRIVLVPMEVRVPQPPGPVSADGKVWLNYELVDRFEHLGKRASIMDALMGPPGDPADLRRGELPLDNAVVRFP